MRWEYEGDEGGTRREEVSEKWKMREGKRDGKKRRVGNQGATKVQAHQPLSNATTHAVAHVAVGEQFHN